MKKIGFIDYYLDEWHANNYPAWIRENAAAAKRNCDVAYAWAEIDQPSGLDTESWCRQYQVQMLSSIEELVEKSDYIVVLSPDHPEHHERLARLPLMSGKPVYMDKTFSSNLDSGIRMFELANKHDTPLFSSSALRFAKELSDYPNDSVHREALEYIATTGPGTYDNYSVHQYEMIVSQMGPGSKQIKSLSSNNSSLLVIEYDDGRQASFSQMQHAPFQVNLQFKNGQGVWIQECTDMFTRLIDSILVFFETGIPPVPKEETLEIIALIDAGKKALENRDTWIRIK
ncbi:Gfo/Idh/MocA family oxidoreductase [Bacillus sp. FSL K6-3431]|uniref:Gfo/Idh/MocA family oxidoreductase n=1 Tax=Bacillus sp. FSL K6-3431 TaxID=2921500 RepID=UPI0030F96AA2